jgi:hypothetical protein
MSKRGFEIVQLGITIVVLGLIFGAGYYVWAKQEAQGDGKPQSINSFEECKDAGYPIMESYPEQCAANGKTFVNDTQQSDQKKEFPVSLPADLPAKEKELIMKRIVKPFLSWNLDVIGAELEFVTVEYAKTMDNPNDIRYTLSYSDGQPGDLGFNFGENKRIDYWVPTPCDDGGCTKIPEFFKEKYPENAKLAQKIIDTNKE